MDAVEFLNQLYRRYKSDPAYYLDTINLNNMEPISFVAQVETWAKEHPKKTRKSEFLKHYPDAPIDINGALEIAPCFMDKKYYKRMDSNKCGHYCDECRIEYWFQEIE